MLDSVRRASGTARIERRFLLALTCDFPALSLVSEIDQYETVRRFSQAAAVF
jgi:hypothetical protein